MGGSFLPFSGVDGEGQGLVVNILLGTSKPYLGLDIQCNIGHNKQEIAYDFSLKCKRPTFTQKIPMLD